MKFKRAAITIATETVREIALKQPTSIRVFEKFGIDYCCGGRRPLVDACTAQNLPLDSVLAALEATSVDPAPATEDWTKASLASLSEQITFVHHAYVKEFLRLARLAELVFTDRFFMFEH